MSARARIALAAVAAAAVLPLLVPASAVSYPPAFDGYGDQLREGLWGGRVQGGLRSEGGDGARGRPLPAVHGRPQARAALVQEHAQDPRRGRRQGERVSVVVVPSAGLMFSRDKAVWVTLPSESKAAYTKLTAGLTPRPARTLPGAGEPLPGPRRWGRRAERSGARVMRSSSPRHGHPGEGSNFWIVALGGGVLAALIGGVAAQDPPPPRVDAASGARLITTSGARLHWPSCSTRVRPLTVPPPNARLSLSMQSGSCATDEKRATSGFARRGVGASPSVRADPRAAGGPPLLWLLYGSCS